MSQRRDSRGGWLPTDRLEQAAADRIPWWDAIVAAWSRLSVVRLAALAGSMGLLLSTLFVLETVLNTVNTTLFSVEAKLLFYLVVGVSLAAATVLARYVRPKVALGLGLGMLAIGLVWHTISLETVPDPIALLASNVELLTGRRVTEIVKADIWALGVAPAPTFLAWYLALRREYVAAAAVGGAGLGYFVLTGDATGMVTLLGVTSAAALIGFGDLDNSEWGGGAPDYVAIVVALMVVTPLVITIVPGGAASPVTFLGSDTTTMEDNVVSADSDLSIVGSVSQSASVRFTVESEQARYWRTGSFDRFTGDGWVRSGGESPYQSETLDEPPGETEYLLQEVDIESQLEALPAAWKPIEVSTSVSDRTEVTQNGGLQVSRRIDTGESYQVLSAVTNPTAQKLIEAGTDYPAEIEERYTQLPASTPDRVGEQTAELVESAETPYEVARLTERWLKENREYSLDVERPDGNIADAFLFEMETGYCTYYATTMVTMLRTQGIPARFAVGYNAGEPTGDGEYVVRGLNSHAWVEVYFPDVGWVPFDPTPADPRQEIEQAAIENARASGSDSVDTEATAPADSGPGEIQTPSIPDAGPNESERPAAQVPNPGFTQVTRRDQIAASEAEEFNATFEQPVTQSAENTDDELDEAGSEGQPILPPREQLALGAIALIGAVAGLRQSSVGRRLSTAVRIRYQRRRDPATDIERAHERLFLLLERRHRPRRPGETHRQYLDAVGADARARRIAELRERAHYADGVSKSAADETVSLVESLREDS
jgi:transglutaminase-like putative cysteine protease